MGQLYVGEALAQLLARLDYGGAALEQGPELPGLAAGRCKRAKLGGFLVEEACEQPRILGIRLVPQVDTFPVVRQLARIDQVHRQPPGVGLVNHREVIARGRFHRQSGRAVQGLEPGPYGCLGILEVLCFTGLPAVDDEFVFGDVDAEGDLCRCFCHNDLRG
jgi:hypothetical protein